MSATRFMPRSAYQMMVLFMPALAGCVPDLNRLVVDGYSVDCQTVVLQCGWIQIPPSLAPLIPSHYQLLHNIRDDYPSNQPGGPKLYQLYIDRDLFLFNLGETGLAGSTLIRTGFADRLTDAPDFVRIRTNQEVAGLFLAYDSRGKPPWLQNTGAYRPVGRQITISLPVGGNQPLPMDVYEVLNGTTGADIPSNNFGNHWGSLNGPPVTETQPVMYLVFVKPVRVPDCAQGTPLKPSSYTDCYSMAHSLENKAEARKKAETTAAERCRLGNGGMVCLAPQCRVEEGLCEATTDRGIHFVIQPLAYNQDSTVTFDVAQSRITGSINGHSFSSPVGGTLDFIYELDAQRIPRTMRVYRMDLDAAPFEAGEMTIGPVSIALMKTAGAYCIDPFPVPSNACEFYRIESEELFGSTICTINGELGASPLEVTSPLDIHLDPTRTSFKIEGNLHTRLTVDGEPRVVEILLDLTGQVRYGPRLEAGTEGNAFSECSERGNQSPLYLNAAMSFQIGNAPAHVTYDWYEDFGLPTQHHWGQGSLIVIDSHRLSYGAHTMTLVLSDAAGILATDQVVVQVVDTRPPTLWAPGNIVYLSRNRSPVYLELGDAEATDLCHTPVGTRNDSSTGSLFPPGETLVTWAADDGRGNTAQAVQSVLVLVADERETLLSAARQGIVQLRFWAEANLTVIAECGENTRCGRQVTSLAGCVSQFHDAVSDRGPADGPQELWQAVADRLQAARDELDACWTLLAEAENAPDDRLALRTAAREQLALALAYLTEIEYLLESSGDEDQGSSTESDLDGNEQPGRGVGLPCAILMPVMITVEHPCAALTCATGAAIWLRRRRRP